MKGGGRKAKGGKMKSLHFAVGRLQRPTADSCPLPTANFLSFILHPSSFILLAALASAPSAAPAMAQMLADPTRPPAELDSGVPESEGVGTQLQSVIISPTRKAAIISGIVVELGGKYGDAVLTKVAEDEVVLTSGDSKQVLKLFPAVEKVEITPRTAKGARGRTVPKALHPPNSAAGGTSPR
jgi:hypothetical protein